MKYKCFHLPKSGNSEEEYEDAFSKPHFKKHSSEFKIAIADGATESSFSKEWAQILVNSFRRRSFEKEHINKTISDLSKIWYKKVGSQPLEWYAIEKFEKGAFAAFLGLKVNLENLTCSISAIGDCCIFVFRENELNLSFPVKSSEEFGSNPYLVSSNLKKNIELQNYLMTTSIALKSGDTVILSSDAFSAWLLKEYEEKKNPLKTINSLLTKKRYKKGFEKWINYLRVNKLIKNDDITVLISNIT